MFRFALRYESGQEVDECAERELRDWAMRDAEADLAAADLEAKQLAPVAPADDALDRYDPADAACLELAGPTPGEVGVPGEYGYEPALGFGSAGSL